jgi:hypothetical protein
MTHAANHTQADTGQGELARRPLGLTIAITAIAALYGALPLLEVYFLHRLSVTADEAYLMGGVEISSWTWLEGLFGGVVLIICLLAWWGRPPWIRFVLIAAILLPTALNMVRIAEALTNPVDPIFGGQTQEAIRDFLTCQLPGFVVVPLYATWYLNRAPARAFYRRVPLSRVARQAPDSASPDQPDGEADNSASHAAKTLTDH